MEIPDERKLDPFAIRDEEEAKASRQSVVSCNKITRNRPRKKYKRLIVTYFQKNLQKRTISLDKFCSPFKMWPKVVWSGKQ